MIKTPQRPRTVLGVSLACATLALTLGCATPGPTNPDLLQRLDTVLRQAAPTVSTSLVLSPTEIRTGAALAAEIRSNQNGYVYLVQLETTGQAMNLVFPNAVDGANYIGAGMPMVLPRPSWRMAARGPAGIGHLLVVVAERQQDVLALQAAVTQGRIEIAGPYGAAMATLRELAP